MLSSDLKLVAGSFAGHRRRGCPPHPGVLAQRFESCSGSAPRG